MSSSELIQTGITTVVIMIFVIVVLAQTRLIELFAFLIQGVFILGVAMITIGWLWSSWEEPKPALDGNVPAVVVPEYSSTGDF